MPDQTQNTSAIDNPTGRFAARIGSFSAFRPQPPRDFRADATNNCLRWTKPADSIITHYRLRIDHDDGESDVEFNEGTHLYQVSFGDRFCLSAFNRSNGMESSLVYVTYHARSGGGESNCSCGSGFTHVENRTMTADGTIANTSYTPCTGDLLTWYITFDSGGPYAVTGWGTQYKNPPTTALDGSPDTLSQVRFVGRADGGGTPRWYCDGYLTALTDL